MSKKEKGLTMNFHDVNESGFVVVQPGRYGGKVSDWKFYHKEDSGNNIYQLEFTLTSGEYEGEKLRTWQVVNSERRGEVFRLYKNLGLIRDGDRGEDQNLAVTALFGDTDDAGKIEVTHLVVNGDERPVIGARATLIVVPDTWDDQPTAKIKKIEPFSVTPDGDARIPF